MRPLSPTTEALSTNKSGHGHAAGLYSSKIVPLKKPGKYRGVEENDNPDELIPDISGNLSKYGKKEDDDKDDDELEAEEEKKQQMKKAKAVPFCDTLKFNMTIGVFIFVNMIFIGLEQDLGYKFTAEDDKTLTPVQRVEKRLTWYILENVFCFVFLVEMLMRMQVYKWKYFYDSWNVLDFCLVMSAVVDTYVLTFIGGSGKVKMLTSLRVVRMLRLVRFVRMLRMFKELWLIVNGLLNSMKTLGWVGLLLGCLLYVFAIFLTNQVGQNHEMYLGQNSYDDEEWPYDVYFGTVPRSMLTLFQILTLDSWCDHIARHIIHKQPYMAVFFVFFLFVTTFGLMNIIVGVIVENTLGAANQTDVKFDKEQERFRKKILQDLHVLFQLSDTDGSGRITRREFQAACRNPKVLEKLDALGLALSETDTLFHLLDPTKRDSIDLSDFITTVKQLIGGAKQKDIVQVGLAVDTLMRRIDSFEYKFSSIVTEVNGLSRMTGDFLRDTLQPGMGFNASTTTNSTSFR
jgi:hypothetical protein